MHLCTHTNVKAKRRFLKICLTIKQLFAVRTGYGCFQWEVIQTLTGRKLKYTEIKMREREGPF